MYKDMLGQPSKQNRDEFWKGYITHANMHNYTL